MGYIEAPIFPVKDLFGQLPDGLRIQEENLAYNSNIEIPPGYFFPRTVLPLISAVRAAGVAGYELVEVRVLKPVQINGREMIVWQRGEDGLGCVTQVMSFSKSMEEDTRVVGVTPDGLRLLDPNKQTYRLNYMPIDVMPINNLADNTQGWDLQGMPELAPFQTHLRRTEVEVGLIFGNNHIHALHRR